MKILKSILGIGLVLALVLTFTFVFAKGLQPGSAQKTKSAAAGWQQNTGYGYGFMPHTNMQELVAKALGLSVDELVQKIQNGQTINDILKEKKLTVDEFKKKLYDLRAAEIDKLLKDGKITKDQAEFLKKHFQANIQYCIDNILDWSNNGFGGMMGFGHGGGMMGFGHGNMMGAGFSGMMGY
ncbi:conserved hypothetical protein [Caldicellulosiruptor hydrothermalis 108]|uniref:DUF2680 domain-containing protein n=1 Tax=Caldicellulosiruptor hydrothermalis (strain DSM 18901 / VKM B-2411 / 108) TaxID=632292 RepID=E4QB32_CALH1|nr:DUF2680 domain-containing protein [Caldicellulosiruptor hydrothermalis]ADQ06010.1 conserved hypothetical protein [Caldicellulosiruptor hydrothermalis 108]